MMSGKKKKQEKGLAEDTFKKQFDLKKAFMCCWAVSLFMIPEYFIILILYLD